MGCHLVLMYRRPAGNMATGPPDLVQHTPAAIQIQVKRPPEACLPWDAALGCQWGITPHAGLMAQPAARLNI